MWYMCGAICGDVHVPMWRCTCTYVEMYMYLCGDVGGAICGDVGGAKFGDVGGAICILCDIGSDCNY